MPPIQDELVSSKEAARLLGIKPQTLDRWRHLGKGPVFCKYERGAVRYQRAVIQQWINERTFPSTSAYSRRRSR